MTWRDAIHIGTSGWHDGHWKGTFYPEQTPEREDDREGAAAI